MINKMERKTELKYLPCELWLKIFENLSYKDLYNVALVCTEWKRLGLDLTLWKKFVMVKKEESVETLERIVSIPRLEKVERIELIGCFVHESVFILDLENERHIFNKHFNILKASKLRQLVLTNCDLASLSPQLVGEVFNQLEHVSIKESVITDEQCENILQSMLAKTKLKALLLDTVFVQNMKSEPKDIDPKIFANALNKLEHLQIRAVLRKTEYFNFFEALPENFITLFELIGKETKLNHLDTDCELLNQIPSPLLIKALNNLQVVNLSSSSITAEQCKDLATAMAEQTRITELCIPMADLSSIDPEIFAKAFTKLEKLDILGARVERQQISAMLKAIIKGSNLKELNLKRISIDGINASIITSALVLLEKVLIFHPSTEQISCLFRKISSKKNLKLKKLEIDEVEMFHVEEAVLSSSINKLESFQISNSFYVFDLMQRIPTNLTPTFLIMARESNLQEIHFVDINLSNIPSSVFAKGLNKRKKVCLIRGSLTSSQITSFFTFTAQRTCLEHLDLTGNDLSGLPARSFLAKPIVKIKTVILVNTKLLQKQSEAIFVEISKPGFSSCIEYFNVKQNDVSKVSSDLIKEAKRKLKCCFVDEYLESDDDISNDEDEFSTDEEFQPAFNQSTLSSEEDDDLDREVGDNYEFQM